MSFPATTPTTPPAATSLMNNAATTAGLTNAIPLDRLGNIEQIVGNLLTDAPAGWQLGASYVAGGAAAGGANTAATLIKRVTGIVDNTATVVLTVTCPNAAHAACVQVTLVGIAGAGGAIGTCEDVTSVSYNISLCRTAGVALGATASTAFGSAAAVVVGAGTMTCVAAVNLVGEGVTVANTCQFKVTIDQSSTSSLHICEVYATLINYLGTGMTIS